MKFFQALLLVASFTARVFTAVGFAAFATTLASVADLILPTALMFGVALWYSSANKVGSNDIFGRATAWAVVVVLVAVMAVVEASVPLSPFAKYFILALWGWETWPLFITALGLYSLTHRPTMEARLEPPPTARPPEEPPVEATPPPAPPPPAGPPPKPAGPPRSVAAKAEALARTAAKPPRGPRPLSVLGGRRSPSEYGRLPPRAGFNPADYPMRRETKPGRPESLPPFTMSTPVARNPE